MKWRGDNEMVDKNDYFKNIVDFNEYILERSKNSKLPIEDSTYLHNTAEEIWNVCCIIINSKIIARNKGVNETTIKFVEKMEQRLNNIYYDIVEKADG